MYIYILPSSCFNLQIRTVKKIEKKKLKKKKKNIQFLQTLQIRTIQKKKWSWINEVLLWGLDLGALVDFVDIRGFGFITFA